MNKPHRTILFFLSVLALAALGTALGQTVDKAPATGGVQNFIEFTKIIPSMDDLLGQFFTVMRNMDVPGVVDTLARLTAGILALLSFSIALLNWGFGKRFHLFHIDGSPNNMLMSVMAVILISTGIPRLVGEAGWAVWRVSYTNVQAKVNPVVDQVIRERTAALAEQVWDFAVTGIASGVQPLIMAVESLKGDTDVTKTAVAGEAQTKQAADDVNAAVNENKKYAGIWQIGSLLIAGMFMAYIGVILGSGLFVVISGMFMPMTFALMPMNNGLIWKQIGGVISSILVASVAPGLFMVNVMVVFDGPIMYLKNMMEVQKATAVANGENIANMMQSCIGKATTDQNVVQKVVSGVVNTASTALGPLGDVVKGYCVVQTSGISTMYAFGQSISYIIIGLIVAGMLFVGLCGLSMMIFREFKSISDSVFGAGGSVGSGSTGAGRALASGVANRMAGAAIGAVGVATGNAQLASAGARSVVSGRNALSGAAASVIERGRDGKVDKARDAKQAASRDENRKYAEDLHNKRQLEADGRREQAQKDRTAQADTGYGSKGDPRSATSGGKNLGADGGAKPFDASSAASSVPQGTRQPGEQQQAQQQAEMESQGAVQGDARDPRQAGSATVGSAPAPSTPSAPSTPRPAAAAAPAPSTPASAAPPAPSAPTPARPASTPSTPASAPAPMGTSSATPAPPVAPVQSSQPTQPSQPVSDFNPNARTKPVGTPPVAGAPTTATPPAPTRPAAPPAPSSPPAPQTLGAFTAEGNAAMRQQGIPAPARDQQAVRDYHGLLNQNNDKGYISEDQARWDLERRGMLPSQRDTNEQRVHDYATQNGISEREAYRTLESSRQLAQFETATRPAPMSYASAADEQAVKATQQAEYTQARDEARQLNMPEPAMPSEAEIHARLRNENALPSQGTGGAQGKAEGSDVQGMNATATIPAVSNAVTAAPVAERSQPSAEERSSFIDSELPPLDAPADDSESSFQFSPEMDEVFEQEMRYGQDASPPASTSEPEVVNVQEEDMEAASTAQGGDATRTPEARAAVARPAAATASQTPSSTTPTVVTSANTQPSVTPPQATPEPQVVQTQEAANAPQIQQPEPPTAPAQVSVEAATVTDEIPTRPAATPPELQAQGDAPAAQPIPQTPVEPVTPAVAPSVNTTPAPQATVSPSTMPSAPSPSTPDAPVTAPAAAQTPASTSASRVETPPLEASSAGQTASSAPASADVPATPASGEVTPVHQAAQPSPSPAQEPSADMRQFAQTRMRQPDYQPAFTPEGNHKLRASMPNVVERDQLAVAELQHHAEKNGEVGRAYSSQEVRQELSSRGLLPSQIDENDRRINAYVFEHGGTREQALAALEKSRGLVQYDTPGDTKG